MPWKNGGGITHELLREPAAPSDFDIRISIAEVASDGQFSIFPGVDRIITLLEGPGFRLDGAAGALHVVDRIAEPWAFRGEDEWMCTLLGGPIRDFNVMIRRASGYLANVFCVADGESVALDEKAWAVLALGPAVVMVGEDSIELSREDLVVREDSRAGLRMQGAGLVVELRHPIQNTFSLFPSRSRKYPA